MEKLEEVLPLIWDELSPEARTVIEEQGVVYTDCEGDLVTSIVNNKDCVFTCYDDKAVAIAPSKRLIVKVGPTSTNHILSSLSDKGGELRIYKAVNYHRWDVCKAAMLLGQKEICRVQVPERAAYP